MIKKNTKNLNTVQKVLYKQFFCVLKENAESEITENFQSKEGKGTAPNFSCTTQEFVEAATQRIQS